MKMGIRLGKWEGMEQEKSYIYIIDIHSYFTNTKYQLQNNS